MSHYVGSLRHIGLDAFGPGWAYAALGHVHEAQRIRGSVPAWYSGAPLTLASRTGTKSPGFSKSTSREEGAAEIRSVPVPQPRRILSLSGDEDALTDALDALKDEAAVTTMKPVAELVYTGADPAGPALIDRLQRRADQTGVPWGPSVSGRRRAAPRRSKSPNGSALKKSRRSRSSAPCSTPEGWRRTCGRRSSRAFSKRP